MATKPKISQLARDARASAFLEYLVLVGGIALGLIALATSLRDTYAAGFIARSLALLGLR